jgi:hypothetical protein
VKRLLSACLLILFALPGLGEESGLTPEDLQSQGRLQVASSVLPAQGIVPGQKLHLVLEIATDRWFTGGTRIGLPEVPGLVILQTEQFASNASENRAGQSWVVQRWTLDVYAQQAGEFTIPPIVLDIQVNAGEAGTVSGRLMSPAVQFSARIPPGLADVSRWVAAPDYSVSQSFDHSLEGLQVGDAFEREIVFEASDVMAMMLPEVELEKSPGLALYPSPPRLDNSSNRGETRARRSRRISYVIEAQGQYLIPGADFAWWDTSTRQLRMLSLPATEILVGTGGKADSEEGTATPRLTSAQRIQVLGGLSVLLILFWLSRVLLPRLPLDRARAALHSAWRTLCELRKPALPAELNPGSSAGD